MYSNYIAYMVGVVFITLMLILLNHGGEDMDRSVILTMEILWLFLIPPVIILYWIYKKVNKSNKNRVARERNINLWLNSKIGDRNVRRQY